MLKSLQLQEVFAPWVPDQGLCPWTPLGALPPGPISPLYAAAFALAMCSVRFAGAGVR